MKKRTFNEIINDPENLSEEEQKDIEDLMAEFFKLSKVAKSYDFDLDNRNSDDHLAKRFYQEYFIMSAILQPFSFKHEIHFKELNYSVSNYIPKKFIWEVPVYKINNAIKKLIGFGLIIPHKTNNLYNPKFTITETGQNILKNQTYQSLASTSFFNYQTYQLSKRANLMNVLMLIVTIMSVLVTIITIFS